MDYFLLWFFRIVLTAIVAVGLLLTFTLFLAVLQMAQQTFN